MVPTATQENRGGGGGGWGTMAMTLLSTPHILDLSSNLSWILSWVTSWKGVVMWFNSSKTIELEKPIGVKEHAQYSMTTRKRTNWQNAGHPCD
jgi:hypothetical protein